MIAFRFDEAGQRLGHRPDGLWALRVSLGIGTLQELDPFRHGLTESGEPDRVALFTQLGDSYGQLWV